VPWNYPSWSQRQLVDGRRRRQPPASPRLNLGPRHRPLIHKLLSHLTSTLFAVGHKLREQEGVRSDLFAKDSGLFGLLAGLGTS
jgi:hypothetical protein